MVYPMRRVLNKWGNASSFEEGQQQRDLGDCCKIYSLKRVCQWFCGLKWIYMGELSDDAGR